SIRHAEREKIADDDPVGIATDLDVAVAADREIGAGRLGVGGGDHDLVPVVQYEVTVLGAWLGIDGHGDRVVGGGGIRKDVGLVERPAPDVEKVFQEEGAVDRRFDVQGAGIVVGVDRKQDCGLATGV